MAAIVTFVAVSLYSAGQQPGLAEQAAAARAQKAVSAARPELGYVKDNDYHNDYFGFELRHLPGWESQSRGQMNVNEAVGRGALGLKAGVHSEESGRVFGMHDSLGSSVYVAIRAIPANAPPAAIANRKQIIEQALRSQFPNAAFSNEKVVLGDSAHRFAAFRVSYEAKGQQIVQSGQSLVMQGHLIDFTVTAPSADELTELLRKLQTQLIWK